MEILNLFESADWKLVLNKIRKKRMHFVSCCRIPVVLELEGIWTGMHRSIHPLNLHLREGSATSGETHPGEKNLAFGQ